MHAIHCVISQRRSHECCSCCCCSSWPCQTQMHYSLQPIGGTVSYTLCADLKVEQQKEQQCNSWLFSGLCVCVFVCVSRLGVFSVAWLRKEKKPPERYSVIRVSFTCILLLLTIRFSDVKNPHCSFMCMLLSCIIKIPLFILISSNSPLC